MGYNPKEKIDRNWSIWREYRKGGVRCKDLAVKYGVSTPRVLHIINRCEKDMKRALKRPFTPPFVVAENSVRDNLLGVEFTFRADDPWDLYEGRGDWVDLDNSWFRYTIGASDE